MAKHRSEWTFHTYHRRIREGRGQGELKEYKPWITIHDIPSRGYVSRICGLKTSRIHHLLSRNETAFFYCLDASDRVLDIREQYPLLPVGETLRIAEETGIRHPRDPKSRYPYVMTSDFLITTADGLRARSIKEKKEIGNPRVREKLEIERRFWKARGVDWKLVTEDEIDFRKAKNIEWVRKALDYPGMLPDGKDAEETTDFFRKLYADTSLSVSGIARATEEAFCLEPGMGILTYQYLIIRRQIPVDLRQPVDIVSARVGNKNEVYSWIPKYV